MFQLGIGWIDSRLTFCQFKSTILETFHVLFSFFYRELKKFVCVIYFSLFILDMFPVFHAGQFLGDRLPGARGEHLGCLGVPVVDQVGGNHSL